jgi:pimeloyl-ACP methyl ester carboxylesterase
MQSGRSQRDLALLLADSYRVHLVDRRGRGAGTAPVVADADVEIEDLAAVVAATGARRLFGISSGAILCARLALTTPSLERLALFEPPLSVDGSMRLDRLGAFDEAMAAGDLPRAMALSMRLSEMGPPWMFRLPLRVLAFASRRMLTDSVRPLVLALPADMAIVRANSDRLGDFAGLAVATLVLSGSATRPYLRSAAAELAAAIPGARSVVLPGLFHAATQNRDEFGSPDAVASVLRDFLA